MRRRLDRTKGAAPTLAPAFLGAGLLLLCGCASAPQLGPVLATAERDAIVERPCEVSGDDIACLEEAEPHVRVRVSEDQELLWMRTSPSLERAVVSLAPVGRAQMEEWRSTLVGLDLVGQRELWRRHLTEMGNILPVDAMFVRDEVVVVRTGTAALIALDAASGDEVWRRDHGTQEGVEPVHFVWLDPVHDFLVIGGEPALLDASNGQILDQRESFRSHLNMRVLSRDPVMNDEAVYAYDAGLLRVSRAERRFEWGREFVTFAEDDYTGKDIGRAFAGVLLHGYAPGYVAETPHDYWVGRIADPILGDPLIVGSMGLVLALDPASGEVLWGVDLAVPQIASLVVADGIVYALAGGQHVLWHGRQGPSAAEPVRYGLYALDLASGEPVESFQSPRNANAVHERLELDRVHAYDEDDAFEEQEDWVDDDERARSRLAEGERLPHTNARLVDMELTDAGLLVATPDEVLLVDRRSGEELRRSELGSLEEARTMEAVGERIVLRTTAGVAAFDARTGDVAWQRETDRPENFFWSVRPGHVPYLKTIDYGPFRDLELREYWDCLLWLDEPAGLVLVRDGPSELLGLDVESGAESFRLPVPEQIVLDRPGNARALILIEGPEADLYRLP